MTQSQKDAFYDKLFAMIVSELKEDEEFMKYVLDNHFGMTKKEVFEAYPNIKNLTVSDSSPRSLLKQKVNANFADYKERWLKMTPSELIDRCEELEAVTRMAQELPSAVSDEDAEYLLQRRQEQLALFLEAMIFYHLSTKGAVRLLGGRWYLSSRKEKVNHPPEKILQQKEEQS